MIRPEVQAFLGKCPEMIEYRDLEDKAVGALKPSQEQILLQFTPDSVEALIRLAFRGGVVECRVKFAEEIEKSRGGGK